MENFKTFDTLKATIHKKTIVNDENIEITCTQWFPRDLFTKFFSNTNSTPIQFLWLISTLKDTDLFILIMLQDDFFKYTKNYVFNCENATLSRNLGI